MPLVIAKVTGRKEELSTTQLLSRLIVVSTVFPEFMAKVVMFAMVNVDWIEVTAGWVES